MKLLAVPRGLRWAAVTFCLSIPFALMEMLVMRHFSWWDMPSKKVAVWTFFVTVVSLLTTIALWRAKKSAYFFLIGAAFIWVLLSVWVAIRMRDPSLGFFSLFLIVFLGIEIVWLGREFHQAYLDPELKWYQGLPKPIPRLQCILKIAEKEYPVSVARMSRAGTLVFSRNFPLAFMDITKKRIKEVELRFISHFGTLKCVGRPILLAGEGIILGVQFIHNSADVKKRIGDMVEYVQEGGYA